MAWLYWCALGYLFGIGPVALVEWRRATRVDG